MFDKKLRSHFQRAALAFTRDSVIVKFQPDDECYTFNPRYRTVQTPSGGWRTLMLKNPVSYYLGKYDPKNKTIILNQDKTPESVFLTFCHELAHYGEYQMFPDRIDLDEAMRIYGKEKVIPGLKKQRKREESIADTFMYFMQDQTRHIRTIEGKLDYLIYLGGKINGKK